MPSTPRQCDNCGSKEYVIEILMDNRFLCKKCMEQEAAINRRDN